ncbi:Polycystic kidney disease 1-like [Brachionus plicatilis]|uniref:Polycystic kidney disease 1-like n=1 Tax=Brachionus plicatilis TaxID=10195 RepID=A0A3M7QXP7_BRAPC|nr:Polycystic kidney disease 1-like [Brachionus plicatilis]
MDEINKHKDRTEKLPVENQSKKSKLKLGLKFPWWFKIMGFLISFLLIGVSVFFIVVKGIEFGNEKVGKWLSSLMISMIASIFLTQPAKPKHYDEDDDEDKIKLENELSDDMHLFKEKNIPLINSDKDLDKIELLEARKDRLRQLKFKIITRELLTHLVFLSLIYMCAFAYKDNFSFRYQKAVRNLFLDEKFRSITNTEKFWTWTRETLSRGLRAQPWYNGDQPYGLAGFVNDFNSRLIGYGILRQLRITYK